ncbi:hypothetical protein V6N13_129059 [Hibiscus sabdariffa]|uniref:Uncharacterized protein n=1 Tax=Hibiscus sabdariffa TaxID=183260 RepID=A0ABR2SK08_9ROSI
MEKVKENSIGSFFSSNVPNPMSQRLFHTLFENPSTQILRRVLSEDKMSSPVVVDRSIVASANRKVFGSAAKNDLAMAGNGMHSTWQSAWPEQSVPSPGTGN